MTCRERCAGCPLADRKIVPGYGRKGGLMIIGEAPGASESYHGKPFVGTSGRLLRDVLKGNGLHPAKTYITNTVICHPPGNKTPTASMIEACRQNLLQEIIEVNPTKILTVGSTPLKALFGDDARISKVRGLGQYLDIPASYKEVQVVSWKPAWIEPKYINERVVLAGDRHVVAGYIKDEPFYLDPTDLTPPKEFKKGPRYKMFKKIVSTVLEPDELRRFFTVATYHPAYILRKPDNYREFDMDVQKAISQDAPLPAPRVDTWIVQNVEEALAALDVISKAQVLGCDTETTGLDPQVDRLLSIGFGALVEDDPDYDAVAVIIPRELVYEPDVTDMVASILDGTRHKGTLVFHNIKFDAQVLHHAGYTILHPDRAHPNLSDTMMLAYHWDERPSLPDEQGEADGTRPQGRSLKTLARVLYDIPDYHFDFEQFYLQLDQGTLTNSDWQRLYTYHGLDCVLTAWLYFDMKQRLDAESAKLYPLAQEMTVPACLTFAAAEYRGIKIDEPYLTDLRVQYIEKRDTHLEFLQSAWESIGKDTELNAGSWQQIETLLQGHRIFVESTQRDPLLHWKAATAKDDPRRDLIDNLIQYRLYKMMLSTFIDGMLSRVDSKGRLHPQYAVDGTATGRIAAKNPNLLNIPSRMGSDIRRAFIADDGMVFVQADYSQVQVRIAASKLYANDPTMRQAYINNEDIYRVVGGKMYRIPQEAITKKQRGYAKTVTLGTLFEQTAQGIIEGREMALMKDAGEEVWTRQEAEFFQSEFFAQFPGFKDYMERQHAFGLKHRYVEDPLGRRRRFPFIAPGMKGHFERQTGNTPIQSGEADVLLTGINKLHREFSRNQKAFIVLSVYDSIMLETWPEHVHEVAATIKDICENSTPFFTDIPFRVDVEVGNSWADLMSIQEWEQTTHA